MVKPLDVSVFRKTTPQIVESVAVLFAFVPLFALTGCDRPEVSQSELGRVSYEVPDNPELRVNYIPHGVPEGVDIYDLQTPNAEILRRLRGEPASAATDTATNEAVPASPTVTGTEVTNTETANAPVVGAQTAQAPSTADVATAPAGDPPPPTGPDASSSSESSIANGSQPPSQGFEILTEDEASSPETPAPEIPAAEASAAEVPATESVGN